MSGYLYTVEESEDFFEVLRETSVEIFKHFGLPTGRD